MATYRGAASTPTPTAAATPTNTHNRNSDSDTDADRHGDAHQYAIRNGDSDADADRHGDAHQHPNRHGDAADHGDSDFDTDALPFAHRDHHADGEPQRDCDGDPYANADAVNFACRVGDAHPDTDRHPRPSPGLHMVSPVALPATSPTATPQPPAGTGAPPRRSTATPPPDCGQTYQRENGAPAGYASDPRAVQGTAYSVYGSALETLADRDAFRSSLPRTTNLATVNDLIARGCSATWIRAHV